MAQAERKIAADSRKLWAAQRSDAINKIWDALKRLKGEGVKPEIYYRGVTFHPGFFGRTKEVEDPSRHEHGWTVGEFEWRLSYYKGRGDWEETKKIPTAIDEEGRLHPCERPGVWVGLDGTTRHNGSFGFQTLGLADLDQIYSQLIRRLPFQRGG